MNHATCIPASLASNPTSEIASDSRHEPDPGIPGSFGDRFTSILAEQAHAVPGDQLLALYDEGNRLGGVSQLLMDVVRAELAARTELPASGGQP